MNKEYTKKDSIICVKIEKNINKQLEDFCKNFGITKSFLIRILIEDVLVKSGNL